MLSFDRYFNSLVNWAYILSLESGEMPVQIVSLPDTYPGLQIRVRNGKLFLFLIQNICCGYSKEPKHIFKLMGKKTITILRS